MLRKIEKLWVKYSNRLRAGRVFFPYREFNIVRKCVFIHIPKNAGTAILHNLGHYGARHHIGYSVFQMADSKLYRSYFSFCVVRNPYDRIASAYSYLMKGGSGKEDDLAFKDRVSEKCHDFDSFVLDYLDKDVIHEVAVLHPQYLYIFDRNDQIQIDFMARYEQLAEDFGYIEKKLGLKKRGLEVVNSSGKGDYKDYYTNREVVTKIAWLYRRDFELLGYSPANL